MSFNLVEENKQVISSSCNTTIIDHRENILFYLSWKGDWIVRSPFAKILRTSPMCYLCTESEVMPFKKDCLLASRKSPDMSSKYLKKIQA